MRHRIWCVTQQQGFAELQSLEFLFTDLDATNLILHVEMLEDTLGGPTQPSHFISLHPAPLFGNTDWYFMRTFIDGRYAFSPDFSLQTVSCTDGKIADFACRTLTGPVQSHVQHLLLHHHAMVLFRIHSDRRSAGSFVLRFCMYNFNHVPCLHMCRSSTP